MQKLTAIICFLRASVLLSIMLVMGACSTSKKVEEKITKAAQALEQKVNNCKNNQERLYTLLQGEYIVHGISPVDSVMNLWRSQTSGDSALAVFQPIGEPSKDGYLVMYGAYFTQLPNEPLANFILKIEQVTRDTLVLWRYECRKYTLEELMNRTIEEELNLKRYIDTSGRAKDATYVKVSNTKFLFSTPRGRYTYSGGDSSRYYRELTGYVGLDAYQLRNAYFTEEGVFTKRSYNIYVRRYHLDLKAWCNAIKEE